MTNILAVSLGPNTVRTPPLNSIIASGGELRNQSSLKITKKNIKLPSIECEIIAKIQDTSLKKKRISHFSLFYLTMVDEIDKTRGEVSPEYLSQRIG